MGHRHNEIPDVVTGALITPAHHQDPGAAGRSDAPPQIVSNQAPGEPINYGNFLHIMCRRDWGCSQCGRGEIGRDSMPNEPIHEAQCKLPNAVCAIFVSVRRPI